MTSKRKIAIYDLDRTITDWPTYSHFLLQSAWRIAPARLLFAPLVPLLMALHKLRLFDRDRLKILMWALLLGRARPDRLSRSAAQFAAFTVRRNIRPGALAQIQADRDNGAMLVLATAAHCLYARPIADLLGFDAVVATKVAMGDDGRVGPALQGRNVYGDAKLAALTVFLDERAISREDAAITFYSDSASDYCVLIWCDEPVAVAPSRRLAEIAASLGWPVADWGRRASILQ